ncbi:hypothetical protein [Pantoea vagans]|uniref:hypothetical protein n=1 Tax=Pantoea vagans TaxID=470934 RepID=UPI0030193E2C
MISDERLPEYKLLRFSSIGAIASALDVESMARELLKLRPCQHHWNSLKLVECGGQYQYCTLCSAKRVSASPTLPQ